MTSEAIERDKLLGEYEKLIDRLYKAEKWCKDNNYTWEFVKASKYKIWHERDNIIKEIEFVRELLGLPNQVSLFYCLNKSNDLWNIFKYTYIHVDIYDII